MLRALTVVLALILAGFVGGAWYFSSQLIDADVDAFPSDTDALLAEAGLAPDPETFAVISADVGIEGWYFPGDDACGLVFLHGYGSNRTGVLTRMGALTDLGCHMVAFDARGHGRSADALHTFGAWEQRDGELVVRWLMSRTGLDAEDIGLIGVSYGGATAIEMLDRVPVAFVVADSPYASLREIATFQGVEQFGDWVTWFVGPALLVSEVRADFDADDASPLRAVTTTDTPILILHEAGDDYTPLEQAEAIAAVGDSVVLEVFDAGGGHATMFDDDPDGYVEMITRFMESAGGPGFGW